MNPEHVPLISLCVLVVAVLYSSVGHAGASGYIAVMALFGLTQPVIKPTALLLNVLVACLATYHFWRYFSWRLFWPFVLLSAPFAFAGGYFMLPAPVFKILIGLVLLFSAVRFFIRPPAERQPQPPSLAVAIPTGAGLGLLSGLTGTGGGIYLTPLLIFLNWATTKSAAAVSALFILVNSLAGLAGNLSATQTFPSFALPLALAALVGGAIGSRLGSRHFSAPVIKRILGVVLAIAACKFLFS